MNNFTIIATVILLFKLFLNVESQYMQPQMPGMMPYGGGQPMMPMMSPMMPPFTMLAQRPHSVPHRKKESKTKKSKRSRKRKHSRSSTESDTDDDSSYSEDSSRESLRSGKKHRQRHAGRRNMRFKMKKKRHILTPVISYVTRDGYVVYQKKINKKTAKDWLELGNTGARNKLYDSDTSREGMNSDEVLHLMLKKKYKQYEQDLKKQSN